jgi:gliding motility-associated-like protein
MNSAQKILPFLLGVLILTILVQQDVVAQNKINNPSFEKDAVSAGGFIVCPPNPLSDWLTPGNSIDLHEKGHWSMGVPIGGGDKHIDVNPNGKIQQFITGLSIGDTCYLSFYTSVHHLFATGCGSTGGTANMSVSCGSMFSTTLSLTGADKAWAKKNYKFIATATSVNIIFEATGSCYGNGGILIDLLELIQPISTAPCDSTKRFANAGKDTSVCIDASGTAKVFLNASGGVDYSWSPASLFSNPNLASVNTSINSTTSFIVKVTDTNGCIDRDTVNIKVNPQPIVVASPKPVSKCVGKQEQLKASGALSYLWTPALGLSSSTISNPMLTVQPGIIKYLVVGTDINGCTNNDSIDVVIVSGPIVNAIPSDTFGCNGTTIQLSAVGAKYYKWFPATSLNNDTIAQPKLTIAGSFSYTVEGRDSNGCLGYDTVNITAYQIPNVKASKGNSTGKCDSAIIQLNAFGAQSYVWTPNIYCDNNTIPNPIVRIPQETVFTVIGTSSNGCTASDTVRASLNGTSAIAVPNAFSPNNDQINDKIHPFILCDFTLKSFSIYNRWGQMVFTTDNINNAWDGNFEGIPCSMDVYHYMIHGINSKQEHLLYKGDITLIR